MLLVVNVVLFVCIDQRMLAIASCVSNLRLTAIVPQVKYAAGMNILTSLGFLAALQGVPGQQLDL